MPNIFSEIPEELPEEFLQDIIRSDSFRLERIVSRGHATPSGQWYDQDWDEWVLLLTGSAGLRIEGGETVVLRPGDHVHLPARQRHRVEWTATETVWLALHYQSED